MYPYINTGMNYAKKNPAVTVLVLIAFVFLLYKGQKVLFDNDSETEKAKKDYLRDGTQPDSFDKATAVDLADRFFNSFAWSPFVYDGVLVKNNSLRAVLEQLDTVDDVVAVREAFNERKVRGCPFSCEKHTFGGMLAFVKKSLLDDYPVLRQANLN